MTKQFSDIEIYVRDVSKETILSWLQSRFDIKGKFPCLTLLLEGRAIDCLIVPDAVKGGYTSVWFKSNGTPWSTDHECAKEAFKFLKNKV